MKKQLIIVGLMMSLSGFGQIQTTIDWPEPDTVNLEDLSPSEIVEMAVEANEYSFWLTFATFNAYLDYCYADSTYVETHPTIGDGNITYAVYIEEWIWIHKEPTFEGYVKWLKRLLDEKP